MSVYVFLGPSLPADAARRICPEAIILPPVRLGDVWRAGAFGGASAIGIIDGYFERVPAVWHKEILWALSSGIAVAGAASMGALRAAELAAFGMVGVGHVFEAYRSGRFAPFGDVFEDDDEVAVSHGPADSGWLSSEAMVNIRATLAAAAEAGVIAAELRDRLAGLGKRLFYKDRSWATLLRHAAAADCDPPSLAALRDWLPAGRVDQKRADATALLHWLAAHGGQAPDVCFAFADTALWRRAVAPPPDDDGAAMLDELRLRPDDWQRERDAALSLLLGDDDAEPEADGVAGATDPEAALQVLCARADREARRLERIERARPVLDAVLLERLRAGGRDAPLRTRAEAKRRHRRQTADDAAPPPADVLLAWFATRGRGSLPAEAEALALLLDLPDVASLLSLLADEYRFTAAGGG